MFKKPSFIYSSAFIACLLFLSALFPPICSAQKVVPEIKTIIHMLPLEKQEWLQDFHDRVTNYINDRTWHEENIGGEFRVTMEFLLQDVQTLRRNKGF